MKIPLRFVSLLFLVLLAQSSLAGTLVQFFTGVGEIDVELYDTDKPITVHNFLRYVESGLYIDSFFHRCPIAASGVTDFILQGGAYYVEDYGTTNAGIAPIPNFPPIVSEFGSNTFYSNAYGTLSMALVAGYTNSAVSSWFFNLTNNPALDTPNTNGSFTVFGRVVRGTNVLNDFIGRAYGFGLVDLNPPLDSLPVDYVGNFAPSYSDLYYVYITILGAQLTLGTNGARQITWSSVSGVTNNVEYTTNLAAAWQVLASTNGTGSSITVTDSSTNKSGRFYRIHVLF